MRTVKTLSEKHKKTNYNPPPDLPVPGAVHRTAPVMTSPPMSDVSAILLRELVAHLRANREQFREEWACNIAQVRRLTALSKDELFAETTSVYDQYVDLLETGGVEASQEDVRQLSARILSCGVETHEVLGIFLVLRDILARSLFKKHQADLNQLSRVLDVYEPAANRIANLICASFGHERGPGIRQPAENKARKKISILLADDHPIMRQGIRVLVEAEPDIRVVGEASNGRQAVELTGKLLPDVVVLDLAMPLLNGLEAARQIIKVAPNSKVLILSSYIDREYVHQVTEAGASGYLPKQTLAEDLIQAIRETSKGNAFFSPAVGCHPVANSDGTARRGAWAVKRKNVLTIREAEVLQLIAEGHLNKQIASELGISIKTVEKHRQLVMCKLNIHDIAGLTRYALSRGMIENPAMKFLQPEIGIQDVPASRLPGLRNGTAKTVARPMVGF